MLVKLEFFVPVLNAEHVKNALFECGAGSVGHYSHCAWQTEGDGQFKPVKESQPYIGIHGKVERIKEYKVEMICQGSIIKKVIEVLKKEHPYETPAYQVIELMDL